MALNNYSKFKISIDPKSKKRQGLQAGDIVRRQYVSGKNTIYSLMCVLETGVDTVMDDRRELSESPYFIAALLDGDIPTDGQILDFVRTTHLYDPDRSGALYMTASDSEAPYLAVIDKLGFEKSLRIPYAPTDHRLPTHPDRYGSYHRQVDGVCHVFETPNGAAEERLAFYFKDTLETGEKVLVSFKARTTNGSEIGLSFRFGSSEGNSYDAQWSEVVDGEWKYFLKVISIDTPQRDVKGLEIGSEWHGNPFQVAEINVIRLRDVANFYEGNKVIVGKIGQVVDPVFGTLKGYGMYAQNLYATRNVAIAGTLTAGDEQGFGSTFYAGRIQKNLIRNSLSCDFSGTASVDESEENPTRIGSVYALDEQRTQHTLICREAGWANKHAGETVTFSAWMRCDTEATVSLYQNSHALETLTVDKAWKRQSVTFQLQETADKLVMVFETGLRVKLCSPQMEFGAYVTPYQPTDDQLTDERDSFGLWACKGGFGGTIQNPLLKLNSDGSISSKDDTFVIKRDGTGHFAGGRMSWSKDDLVLKDVTIRWEDLDETTKDNLVAKSVTISGDTVVNYQGNTPDKESLTLIGIENNVTPTQRQWEYKQANGSWAKLGTNLQQVIGVNDALWEGRKSVEIRYTVTYGKNSLSAYENILKVTSGAAGVGISSIERYYLASPYKTGITVNSAGWNRDVNTQPIDADTPYLWCYEKTRYTNGSWENGQPHIISNFAKDGVTPALPDWVEEWDSGKTLINETRVITPNLFVGSKDNAGLITGMTLGSMNVKSANSAGSVTTMRANGIYGFNKGVNTWFFDSLGNAQLGNDRQYIKYNSSTGKVEFGPDVRLSWGNIEGSMLSDSSDNQINNTDFKYTQASAGATPVYAGVTPYGVRLEAENSGYIKVVVSSVTDSSLNNNCITFATNKVCDPASLRFKIYCVTTGSYISVKFGYNTNTIQKKYVNLQSVTELSFDNVTGMNGQRITIGFGSTGTYRIYANSLILTNSSTSHSWRLSMEDLRLRTTNITQNGIYTGTLQASQVVAGIVSANTVETQSLQSKLITADFIETLNIDAVKGTIGGWKIENNYIYTGTKKTSDGYSSGGITLYATQTAGSIRSKNFYIDTSGNAFFKGSGEFTGKITASSGKIAGWTINTNNITNNDIYLGSNGDIYCEYSSNRYWEINNVGEATFAKGRVFFDNDGSGYIANGNIEWDVNGNITFGNNVTVKAEVTAAQINSLSLNTTQGKIGGWTISSSQIYKGNISINSSGYIRNSGKWSLNSDGSGYLAGSNKIYWDASGNFTIENGRIGYLTVTSVDEVPWEPEVCGSLRAYTDSTGTQHQGPKNCIFMCTYSSVGGISVARYDKMVGSVRNFTTFAKIKYNGDTQFCKNNVFFCGEGDGVISDNTYVKGSKLSGWIGHQGQVIKITSNGTVSITGTSDIRLKNVLCSVDGVLEKLEKLDAFYYTLKYDENKMPHIGVSAQAVRELFPGAVRLDVEHEGGLYYSVDYFELLTAVGVNGVKELHAKVKRLEERIAALESRQ